jgi:hypothetical protein
MNKKELEISSIFNKIENSIFAKNKLFLGIISLIFVIGLVSLVSAYSSTVDLLRIREGSQTLIQLAVDWAEPFLQALLGGNSYTGELLFEKFLLFILFFSFIWLSLKQVKVFTDQKAVMLVITFVVSILAIRYMDFMWINTIIQRYQVLGIAITSLIPFVIFFFFINSIFPENSVLRKLGWILFICIYIGMYITTPDNNFGIFYFWTAIVGIIFLLMDGTIARLRIMQKYKESSSDNLRKEVAKLQEDIDLFESKRPPGYERTVKRLRKRQADLSKYIGK